MRTVALPALLRQTVTVKDEATGRGGQLKPAVGRRSPPADRVGHAGQVGGARPGAVVQTLHNTAHTAHTVVHRVLNNMLKSGIGLYFSVIFRLRDGFIYYSSYFCWNFPQRGRGGTANPPEIV